MNVLYTDLKDFFRKYVHAPESEIGIMVQYAVATHLYESFNAFPNLHIQGDFATGKNRRLELIESICYKPITFIDPTTSSLFRTIDANKGTVLIDEADNILESKQLKNCILAGYKKGGCIIRSARDDNHSKGFVPVTFDVYCPKVLVTRGGIQNDALLSRCITITTLPKPQNSNVPDILPNNALVEGSLLKNRIISNIKNLKAGV